MKQESPAKIVIRPLCAEITTEKSYCIGKHNLFCSIILGEKKLTSTVCNSAGRSPHWHDTFEMNVGEEDLIKVQLWHKESQTKSDFLGEGEVNINTSEKSCTSVQLYYDGAVIGKIELEMEYKATAPQKSFKNIFKALKPNKKVEG